LQGFQFEILTTAKSPKMRTYLEALYAYRERLEGKELFNMRPTFELPKDEKQLKMIVGKVNELSS